MSFATCLEELLEKHDISEKELSASVNISQSVISRLVTGEREPRVEHIAKICTFFDVSIDSMDLLSVLPDKERNRIYQLGKKQLTDYTIKTSSQDSVLFEKQVSKTK